MLSQKILNKIDFLKTNKTMNRILLIGGNGQIGEALQFPLSEIYGVQNVLVTDLEKKSDYKNFKELDAMNIQDMKVVFEEFKPDLVLHLVALLSGIQFK